MWARHLELSLGLWLAVSPFVFRFDAGAIALWWIDLGCAALIVVLSLLTYWQRARYAHLAGLAIAAGLVGHGWWSALAAPTPAAQNHVLVGLLLGMLALVPSHASRPPAPWRDAVGE
jgi:hypothetical protein